MGSYQATHAQADAVGPASRALYHLLRTLPYQAGARSHIIFRKNIPCHLGAPVLANYEFGF